MTLLAPPPTPTGDVARVLAGAAFGDERLAGDWVADAGAGARLRRMPDAPWARLLAAHLGGTGGADPGVAVPYGWLLGPLAARAWADWDDAVPADVAAATLAAHVRRAAWWLGPALHRDFAAVRDRHLHRLDVALAARADPPPTALYAAYRRAAGPTGAGVWRRRPVLARLAAQLAVDEVVLLRGLWRHLAEDGAALCALLGVPALAPVAGLAAGLGDRHDGGRSVCRVTFADGHRLIYRPRRHDGLGLLAAALAGRAPLPAQVTRDDHCWVSFVPAAAGPDPVAYHAAAGRLLGVLDAAGATDIHRDNLVRTAAGPAVVDAETLAHPVTAFETAAADPLADRPLPPRALVDSPLRVGLLPAWDFAADGCLLDGGHLLPALPGGGRIAVPTVVRAGTDAETVTYAAAPPTARADLPAPGYDPAPYADVVADAYAAAAGGAVAPPPGHRVRLLLRYTRRYVDVLLRALARPDLREGVDLDRALAALPAGGTDIGPAVRAAELADLRRLDVPYLEWEPDTGTVRHAGRPVGVLAAPPRRRPAAPAARALVRATLRARDGLPRLDTDPAAASGARAAALAMAVLRDLADRAVPLAGGLTWCGSEHRHGRFVRLPVGWSLYDGQAGIAVGLAAGATVDNGLARYAAAAAAPLLDRVLADPGGLCRRLGPGYLHGAAGVLWALRALAPLTPHRERARVRAAENALAEALCADLPTTGSAPVGDLASTGAATIGDLADGLPGALAVLAAPTSDSGRRGPRAAVARVAAAVLSTLDLPAPGPHRRDGLAHGRAGVALGLRRAGETLGGGTGRTLAEAASRLLAADAATGWTWCTGATGVTLAAGRAAPVAGRPTPAAGWTSPVAELPEGVPHHLCCGVLGAAVAGRIPGAVALDRLAADGTPRYLRALPAGLHQPGLFQGAAGVALGALLLTRTGLPDPLRVDPEPRCPR